MVPMVSGLEGFHCMHSISVNSHLVQNRLKIEVTPIIAWVALGAVVQVALRHHYVYKVTL